MAKQLAASFVRISRRCRVSESPAERATRERFEKWASFYPWDDPDDYGFEKFGGGRYKLLEIQICWEAWKAAESGVARAIEESRQPDKIYEALKLANEWAAMYPLSELDRKPDFTAAAQVYEATIEALTYFAPKERADG